MLNYRWEDYTHHLTKNFRRAFWLVSCWALDQLLLVFAILLATDSFDFGLKLFPISSRV